jgi:threonine/homoserine/homoserine lactone efflux protein
MPTLETLISFSIAAFLLCISPGPSNLYILARSMAQGSHTGAVAAAGMALGSLIYVVISVLGLATLFLMAPILYVMIKIVGALYLLYLGFHYFKQANHHHPQQVLPAPMTMPKIFKQSLVVELTNPKTALFFVAFLPLFVQPEQGQIAVQLLILGLLYTLIGFCSDVLVATLSGQLGRWLRTHPAAEKWQLRGSGTLLLAIAGLIVYDVIRADLLGNE